MSYEIDYYGIVILLRKLLALQLCTSQEALQIASRIAVENDVHLTISL